MKPYDLTGANAALFIGRNLNGVLWMSGIRNKDEIALGDIFGKQVVWAKVVFVSRHKNVASRIGNFSLN